MICGHCGAQNRETDAYCARCGGMLAARGAPLQQTAPPGHVGSVPPTAPTAGYVGPTRVEPYASARGLSTVVTLLLAACIVTDVTLIGSLFLQIQLLSREFTMAEGEANDIRHGLIALAGLGAYVLTVVVFLVWIHRASKNLKTLGVVNQKYSPGWAVGWWFIPFLNLVRPFQVVREIWQRSDPSVDTSHADGPSTPTLGCWWACWLIGNFLAQISLRASFRAETAEALTALSGLDVASCSIEILAGLLLILIVRGITARQDAKFHGASSPPAGLGPPPITPLPPTQYP